MIKCIIFDCDGTLVDSEYLCNLGLELTLKDYGLTESALEMMSRFRGGKLAQIVKSLEKKHNISFRSDFVSSYRDLVDVLFKEKLKVCPGVIEVLESIEQSKCVASNGPLHKMRTALSITNLSVYFGDNIYSAYDVDLWKPDPGVFLHAAKKMGFLPHECAVVEDSPVGIAAASAAGMISILYDPNLLYSSLKSTYKIQHMCELTNVIS